MSCECVCVCVWRRLPPAAGLQMRNADVKELRSGVQTAEPGDTAGPGPDMWTRMKTVQLLLLVPAALCAAPGYKEWNEADGAKASCSNLTLVLDNWKFAIMTQVKDLLLHDHNTVLPDYGRIRPLSDALGDLYREFNSLKERLSQLTAHFDGVESFVDEMRSGGNPPRGSRTANPGPQGRRSRVVIRRVIKPVVPQN